MRAAVRSLLAAALVFAFLLGGGGAQASKAAPPRSTHNATAAWNSRCDQQLPSWPQQMLCGIRSHDKAIAIACASLVFVVLGWVWVDAAKRARDGGREWESNPPRAD